MYILCLVFFPQTYSVALHIYNTEQITKRLQIISMQLWSET